MKLLFVTAEMVPLGATKEWLCAYETALRSYAERTIMKCTRCKTDILKGDRYWRTRQGPHHKVCPPFPGRWYQPLFNLMSDEHNRILLESDMDEIILVVEKMLKNK